MDVLDALLPETRLKGQRSLIWFELQLSRPISFHCVAL